MDGCSIRSDALAGLLEPMIRALFRRIFPRLRDPLLDAPIKVAADDARLEAQYLSLVERNDPFLAFRYYEGTRWRNVLGLLGVHPGARLLDLGAGDGAIELAFAAGGYDPVSVDAGWNDNARRLGVRRVIADAATLPFRPEVFDAVVFIETIEHLPDVREAASELARVARPGAIVLATTPPRWRFALRRDPHFGIRGLLLLPAALQRDVAARRGFDRAHHFVDRIYSSTSELASAMAPLQLERVLSRSRAPRRWFWDAIVFRRD